MLALVTLDNRVVVAQAKKEAKTKEAGDEAKETKKKEVKFVANIPPVTDKMATSQGAAQVAKINESLRANWLANKINPSERCSDYEFIRRASLDIVGRIATEKEVGAFMGQKADTRRSWLIENLLKSDECGEHLADMWTVMLLTRTGSQKMYQEQLRDWLTMQLNTTKDGSRTADWSKIVTELLTATGKTNDNAAVNFVAHHIGDPIRADESKKGMATPEELKQNGKYDMVPVTSRTTRLFLGIRTQCVQCHDHPFNGDWQQGHFWGINAFFRQTTVSQRPGMMMANQKKKGKLEPPQIELINDSTYNEKGIVSYEQRSGVLLVNGMKFLDGTRVKQIPSGSNRRVELAKLISNHPSFSKVYVNRTWANFFGKSFTKDAADDFGAHNEASNPELLDYLAEEFTKYNRNPRELMRWICNSQAYGLSSKSNSTNDKPDDEPFFARMLLKSMSPEQLFESLMTATASKIGGDKQAKHELRTKWLDSLVLNFGNDEGEEGSFSGTVVQALMLMNGDDINKAIMDQNIGTVANVLREKGINAGAIGKLYLAALNRPPTATELAALTSPKMSHFHNPKVKTNQNSPNFHIGYYQDIFWALLNSSEFILNH